MIEPRRRHRGDCDWSYSGWPRARRTGVVERIENAKGIVGTYSLLAVTGRGRSIRRNGASGNSEARLTVDLDGWDGSDVFEGAMPLRARQSLRGYICKVRGQG